MNTTCINAEFPTSEAGYDPHHPRFYTDDNQTLPNVLSICLSSTVDDLTGCKFLLVNSGRTDILFPTEKVKIKYVRSEYEMGYTLPLNWRHQAKRLACLPPIQSIRIVRNGKGISDPYILVDETGKAIPLVLGFSYMYSIDDLDPLCEVFLATPPDEETLDLAELGCRGVGETNTYTTSAFYKNNPHPYFPQTNQNPEVSHA